MGAQPLFLIFFFSFSWHFLSLSFSISCFFIIPCFLFSFWMQQRISVSICGTVYQLINCQFLPVLHCFVSFYHLTRTFIQIQWNNGPKEHISKMYFTKYFRGLRAPLRSSPGSCFPLSCQQSCHSESEVEEALSRMSVSFSLQFKIYIYIREGLN